MWSFERNEHEGLIGCLNVRLDDKQQRIIVEDENGQVLEEREFPTNDKGEILARVELERYASLVKDAVLARSLPVPDRDEILERLDDLLSSMQCLLTQCKQRESMATFSSVGHAVMRHLCGMRTTLDPPYDALCWHVRNVFELYLWLAGMAENEDSLARYYAHREYDYYEIQRAFLSLVPDETAVQYVKNDNLRTATSRANKYGKELPKGYMKVADLAKEVDKFRDAKLKADPQYRDALGAKPGQISADNAFAYKVLNKFVHPTPVSVSARIDKSIWDAIVFTAIDKGICYGEMARDALAQALHKYAK